MQEVLEEKEYHVEMLQKDEVEYREEICNLEKEIFKERSKQDQTQIILNEKMKTIAEMSNYITNLQKMEHGKEN